MRHERGFTMVELIAVMIIISILAVSVAQVYDRRSLDTYSYAQSLRSQLAYAQKLAVSSRRTVFVTANAGGLLIAQCTNAACSSQVSVVAPGGAAAGQKPSGSSITLSASPAGTFTFAPSGAASASVVLTVTGDVVRNVAVEAATGYVH